MSKKIIKSILAISIILIVAVAAISIGNIAPTSDSLGRGDSDAIISTVDTNAAAPSGTTEVVNLEYDGSSEKYNAGIYYNSSSIFIYNSKVCYFKKSSESKVTLTYYVTHTSMGIFSYYCYFTFGLYTSSNEALTETSIEIQSKKEYHTAGHSKTIEVDASRLRNGETYKLITSGIFKKSQGGYTRSWDNEITMTYDSQGPIFKQSDNYYTNVRELIGVEDYGSSIAKIAVKYPGKSDYYIRTFNGVEPNNNDQIAIGGEGEGEYVYYAIDKLGNVSDTKSKYYDVTRPVMSCSVASGASTSSKVSVSASDNGSGISQLYCKYPGSTEFSQVSGTSFSIGNDGEGQYELYAVDRAGNSCAPYRVTYDSKPPKLNASVSSGGYTNSRLTISADDEVSGVAKIYCKSPSSSEYTQKAGTLFVIGDGGEGWYEAYAVDNAGNRSSTYKLYYDITKPTLSAAIASGDYTSDNTVISAADNVSGIAQLYYKTPSSSTYAAQTSHSYAIGGDIDGWYEVYAIDVAGNRSDTYKIFYDSTAPNIAIRNADGHAVPDIGYANSGIYFTLTDNTRIGASVLYMYLDGTWQAIISNLHTQSVHTDTTVYYDNRAIEQDRVYYASRSAALAAIYDLLEREIKEYTSYAAADSEGCTIPSDQLDLVQAGAVYYKFTYDSITYLYFSLDTLKTFVSSLASTRIASSSKQLYSNGDGKYRIEVTDICGNTAIKTFVVDTTPPNAEVNGYSRTYNSTPIISDAHTLELDASDVNLDRYVINGHEVPLSAEELLYYVLPKDKFVEGKNVLTVYDKAGNSRLIYYYYDSIAPSINVTHNKQELSHGDAFSGKIAQLQVEIEESFFFDFKVREVSFGIKRASIDTAAWSDGEVIIEAEDFAGNKSVLALVLDNTPPSIVWSGHNKAEGLNVYASGSVGVSAVDMLDYTMYYRRLGDSEYARLTGDISVINATYSVYAIDAVGNACDIYTLLISVLDDFGNEAKIHESYKVNSFYIVDLPAKIFAVDTKENIAGKYSFINRDDAMAWAISKEYEYRVSETASGWLYVSPSKENVIQLYTDRNSLMSVVDKYAQRYVDGERMVVNSANAQYYTMMSSQGIEDKYAFIAQHVRLPEYLSEYSHLSIYQMRRDYIYQPVALGYGTFAGGIRYTLIGNDYAAVSGAEYDLAYGQSINDAAHGRVLEQGYYLVTEYDYCGNAQQYIVYIDTEAPVLSAVAAYGDGDESTVVFDAEYIDGHKTTMYYVSLDLAAIADNIDDFFILRLESNKGYAQTFIQGDELPLISAAETGSGIWTAKLYDRSGNVSIFTFYIADSEPYWNYSSLTSVKNVTIRFNVSESYNAVTNIEIYRMLSDGTPVKLDKDSKDTPINAMTLSYIFDVGGKFVATVRDLFGRTVEFGPIFYLKGLPTGSLGGVTDGGVTNGDVNFRYGASNELIVYTYMDDEWIELERSQYMLEYSATSSVWTATFEAGEARHDDFKLFLYNKDDDTLFVEYTFRIDNILADFSIIDADGKRIEPGGSTNKPFYLTWEESGVRMTSGAAGVLSGTYKKGVMIDADGTYNFTIKDYAGNTMSFSVLLDTRVSYKVEGNYKLIDGIYYTSKAITVTVGEIFNSFEYISSNGITVVNGAPITYDGSYYVRIVDYYGNVAEVDIVIDSVAPSYELLGVSNGGSTAGRVILSWDSADAAKACLVDRNNNIISDSIVSGAAYDDEGAYYVRLTDICDNSVLISFNIDKSVSYTADIVDKQVTTDKVTFKFNEAAEITVTRDGEQVSGLAFSDIGAYRLVAVDAVGNTAAVDFYIISRAYREFNYSFPDGSAIVGATIGGQAIDIHASGADVCLSVSGDYALSLSSPNGQAYILSFAVDNIAPTADMIEDEDGSITIGNFNKDNLSVQLFKDGESVSYQIGDAISSHGDYTVVISDTLGNTSTYQFTIPYRLNAMSIAAIVIGVVAVIVIVAIIIAKRKIKS